MAFVPYGKTPRLRRDVTITEKIDGTNACVVVLHNPTPDEIPDGGTAVFDANLGDMYVYAQSRKRIIRVGDDNYGFAGWVAANAIALSQLLGPGYHFGEWWGNGVQRGYEQERKRFSVFNPGATALLAEPDELTTPAVISLDGAGDISTVPILKRHVMSDMIVNDALYRLRRHGSYAAPGFERPEGIIIYHRHANQRFKVTLEEDHQPKGVNL